MMNSSGYTSLPGGWQQERRKSVVNWGSYHVPAVPSACWLLIVVGLPMWAAGMLQARSTTDDIFGGIGFAADSIAKLKVAVLTSVLLLAPLAAVVLVLNIWLEWSTAARSGHANTRLSLSRYTSHSTNINAANWVLLLLSALALSSSVAWLTVMDGVLSAAGGGPEGPPWWPPAAAAAAAAAPPLPPPAASILDSGVPVAASDAAALPAPALQAAVVATAAQQQAAALAHAARPPSPRVLALSGGVFDDDCSAGCSVRGAAAALLGLPTGCCKLWPLTDLKRQLQQAVRSLSIAVAGALLLLVGQSLLFGYLAGQAVHAARDLEELLKQGNGLLVVGGTGPVAAAGSSMAEAPAPASV